MKDTSKKYTIMKKAGYVIYGNKDVLSIQAHNNKKEYIQKYDAQNYRTFVFRLNKKTDQDMIAFLESQENFAGLMKKLIREEMNKNNK